MQPADEMKEILAKVCLVGAPQSGKTALRLSAIQGTKLTQYKSTIGVEFSLLVCKVTNTLVRLQLWDIAGYERDGTLLPAYFKDSDAFIIFVDSSSTLEVNKSSLTFWEDAVRKKCRQAKVFVILTKSDSPNPKSSESQISDLLKTYKNVEYLGACDAREQAQTLPLMRKTSEFFLSSLPQALKEIEALVNDNPKTTLSGQQLVQDLQSQEHETDLARKAECYLLLMAVYLSNPLGEKPDEFYWQIRDRYTQLLIAIQQEQPKIVHACLFDENLFLDPQLCELLKIDHPSEVAPPARVLINTLAQCLYSVSVNQDGQKLRALCEFYEFELPKDYFPVRLHLLSYVSQIRAQLELMTLRALHTHVEKLLATPEIVGTGFIDSPLKKALLHLREDLKKSLKLQGDSNAAYEVSLKLVVVGDFTAEHAAAFTQYHVTVIGAEPDHEEKYQGILECQGKRVKAEFTVAQGVVRDYGNQDGLLVLLDSAVDLERNLRHLYAILADNRTPVYLFLGTRHLARVPTSMLQQLLAEVIFLGSCPYDENQAARILQRGVQGILQGKDVLDLLPEILSRAQNISPFANKSTKLLVADLSGLGYVEERAKSYFQLLSVYLSNMLGEKPDAFFHEIKPIYFRLLEKLITQFPEIIKRCIAEGNFPTDPQICSLLHKLAPKNHAGKAMPEFLPKSIDLPSDEWAFSENDSVPVARAVCKAIMKCLYTCDNDRANAIAAAHQLKPLRSVETRRAQLLNVESSMLNYLLALKTPPEDLSGHLEKLLRDPEIHGDSELKKELSKLLQQSQQLQSIVIPDAEPVDMRIPPLTECLAQIHTLAEQNSKRLISKDLITVGNGNAAQMAAHLFQLLSHHFSYLDPSQKEEEFTHKLYSLYLKLMIALIQKDGQVIADIIHKYKFPTAPHICCVLPNRFEKPHPLMMLQAYAANSFNLQRFIPAYTAMVEGQSRLPQDKPDPIAEQVTRLIIECLYKHSQTSEYPQNRPQDPAVTTSRQLIQALSIHNHFGHSLRCNLTLHANELVLHCVKLNKKQELHSWLDGRIGKIAGKDDELARALTEISDALQSAAPEPQ